LKNQSDHSNDCGGDKDKLFATAIDNINGFTFDDKVVSVFTDMIDRSVPGYATTINMIGMLAQRYAQQDTSLYDLGCSLGAATFSMGHQVATSGCDIISIDNSSSMIAKCKENLLCSSMAMPVTFLVEDITSSDITNASVIVLNFTLQFIPKEKRTALLQTIYNGLRKGGILIISEKICFDDDHLNALLIDLHHNFKKAKGYSSLEISQKRNALENVLIPETIDVHKSRLNGLGFNSVDVWFQCMNFASMVAIK
jgi:tRNA (cmo5U34)-methyltransferase